MVHVDFGTEFQPLTSDQRLKPGDQIVLAGIDLPADPDSVSEETGQLRHLLLPTCTGCRRYSGVVGIFCCGGSGFGVKGLLSIVGMLGSLGLLTYFVLPMLLSGANPVMVTL